MERVIKIDINSEEHLLEKYDTSIVNHQLIEYIIKKSLYFDKEDTIKIVINNKCNTNVFIREKIIEGLQLEYSLKIKEHYRNNLIQFLLLLLGITFLFFSTFFGEELIWKEVMVIGGWVPIWEMVRIELFDESKIRRRKRLITKIIKSEFEIEINNKNYVK